MLKLKKFFFLIALCLTVAGNYAQQMDAATGEPADFMSSNGKIYVVMTVAIIIVLGLFIYLANLDRKIKKLEKGDFDKV